MKTKTELVEFRKSTVHEQEGPRYFTTVVEKQTFLSGQYAGKSYRLTSVYVSGVPQSGGYRGQFVKSSSEPWKEES